MKLPFNVNAAIAATAFVLFAALGAFYLVSSAAQKTVKDYTVGNVKAKPPPSPTVEFFNPDASGYFNTWSAPEAIVLVNKIRKAQKYEDLRVRVGRGIHPAATTVYTHVIDRGEPQGEWHSSIIEERDMMLKAYRKLAEGLPKEKLSGIVTCLPNTVPGYPGTCSLTVVASLIREGANASSYPSTLHAGVAGCSNSRQC